MFSIGAFSRLAQLSIRVLRHYDEIGLLKPAHVNPTNGYRSYSADQLADVNRIIALKELGLGLEAIQRVLSERCSLEEIRGMLRLEKARAEAERSVQERRLQELDRRLRELGEVGRLSEIDVVEKSVAATPFLAYRATAPELADAYALMNDVMAACASLAPGTPFIGVAHDAFFDSENLDIELGYPVSTPERIDLGAGRIMTVRELPAVHRMLSVVYVGDQVEGHRRSHSAMAVWLDAHRCDFAGPGRELVHGGRSPEQTVEIQYPIAPRDAAGREP